MTDSQASAPAFLRPGFWIGLAVSIATLGGLGYAAWQLLPAGGALPGEVTLPSSRPTLHPDVRMPASFFDATLVGLQREVDLHTGIPTRGPDWIIPYTVESGDTVNSIAAKFNLTPDSLVWGNPEMLADDANILRPGQTLNILPVDGAFHQWREKDTLPAVADEWSTTVEAIVNWPGNKLNPLNPEIWPGTWLIIPGGSKPFEWEAPIIRNGKSATYALGAGQCPAGYDGPMGTGAWQWPSRNHYLSGTNYMPPAHPGIDIAIYLGEPIYSIDAGVIVFAGWSQNRNGTPGYGYLVIIDHLNGWHSFYAHLNQVNVTCGQKIPYSGYPIGLGGSTGNSTGPHLHFEMRYGGVPQNPLGLLP